MAPATLSLEWQEKQGTKQHGELPLKATVTAANISIFKSP